MALTKAKLIADGVIVAANLHSSHGITSADIGENTNLYFTNARARSAISVSGNALSYNSSTGVITSNFEESPTFTGDIAVGPKSNATVTVSESGGATTKLMGASVGRVGTYSNHNFEIVQNSSAAITIDTSKNVGIGVTPEAWTVFNPVLRVGDGGALTGTGTSNFRMFANTYYDGSYKRIASGTATQYEQDGYHAWLTAASGTANSTISWSEGMRLTTTGLGIGTTSPAVKLEIQDSTHTTMKIRSGNNDNILFAQAIQSSDARIGTDTNTDLSFYSNASERMRIKGSGNIGIGTTSPLYSLDVDGHIQVNNTIYGKSGADLILQARASQKVGINSGGSRTMTLNASQQVGIGTTSPNDKLHIVGNLFIEDSSPEITFETGSSHYNWQIAAQENVNAALEFSVGSQDANASNDTFSPKMIINSSGNVGIGVTSPTNMLSIKGSSGSSKGLDIFHSNGNKVAELIHNGSGDEGMLRLLDSGVETVRIAGENNIASFINSGNVGINETAPAAKLQVSGDTDGNSEYVAILGEDGGANGAANSANTTPVHKTLLTGYSIPYSGQTNARLTSVGFLEFDSTPGWTSNQRNWALTSGYDMGGTGGPKFAIILGNAQNVEPQLGTNGAVGTGDGSNTLVATHWNNARKMTHTGALHVDSVITANDSINVQGDDKSFICRNAAGTVIGTIGAESSSTPNVGMTTVRNNGTTTIQFNSNGSSYINGGNVGIGTTSPDQKLVVNQTATGRYVIKAEYNSTNLGGFFVDGSGNNELFMKASGNVEKVKIDTAGASHFSGGNVGIGSSSPQSALMVKGAGANGTIRIVPSAANGEAGIGFYQDTAGTTMTTRWVAAVGGWGNSGDFTIGYGNGGPDLLIQNDGRVGINTTTPYGRLDVYGALTVGPANQDPGVTLTETGNDVSLGNGGGSIEINMPLQGTTTNGCTLTFTYAAASWKSWILDYEFASTDGMVKGVVGGYNNGSTGHSKTKMLEGFSTSVAVAAVGSGNQHVQVTFTFSSGMGIHPFARFIYSQGGGDGTPRADRVTVAYVEGS